MALFVTSLPRHPLPIGRIVEYPLHLGHWLPLLCNALHTHVRLRIAKVYVFALLTQLPTYWLISDHRLRRSPKSLGIIAFYMLFFRLRTMVDPLVYKVHDFLIFPKALVVFDGTAVFVVGDILIVRILIQLLFRLIGL